MPQVDIQYSNALNLDFPAISNAIDAAINDVDGPGRDCKIRTVPASFANIEHLMISVGLLEKPHRDKAFREKLVNTIFEALQKLVPQGVTVCINPYWLDDTYLAQAIA